MSLVIARVYIEVNNMCLVDVLWMGQIIIFLNTDWAKLLHFGPKNNEENFAGK